MKGILMKNLYLLDTQVLARIYNNLNSWKWDEALGKKPEGWDALPAWDKEHKVITKAEIIRPIMDMIESIIGKKECLRHHWVSGLNRTNEQFEVWWGNLEERING
jgi:hypothetical protein